MLKSRIGWFIVICITIALGLASRYFKIVPLFVGDILWATMVYFIVRFLFIHKRIRFIVIASLLFSYAIEVLQLYKAPWIENIRPTLFGRLVLGSTFNWGDMISYTVGVGLAVLVDYFTIKKRLSF